MSFAIIKTGGKQYRVSPGQKLKIEKLAVPAGDEPRSPRFARLDSESERAGEAGRWRDAAEGSGVSFDQVLLVANGEAVEVGTPNVVGAVVEAKVLRQARDRKKIVFKYHAKTRYHKKKGHRQPFTEVQIQAINMK